MVQGISETDSETAKLFLKFAFVYKLYKYWLFVQKCFCFSYYQSETFNLKRKKIVKKKSGICSFRLIAGKKIELKNLTYLIGTVQSRFSDILFSDNFAKDHFLVHKNISFSDNLVFSAPSI